MDTIDVIVPARNEDQTIGQLLSVLKAHPAIGRLIVMVDGDTSDETAEYAAQITTAGDVIHSGMSMAKGKGQCVRAGIPYVTTDMVLLCDADITGLTYDHVSLLLSEAILGNPSMTIGVPDIPSNYPTERIWAWPWVSGERCVPTNLIRPLYLHGYLMETQINQAAKHANMPLHFEWLQGLTASYYMSERRIREMTRDAEYGREHGILLCHQRQNV